MTPINGTAGIRLVTTPLTWEPDDELPDSPIRATAGTYSVVLIPIPNGVKINIRPRNHPFGMFVMGELRGLTIDGARRIAAMAIRHLLSSTHTCPAGCHHQLGGIALDWSSRVVTLVWYGWGSRAGTSITYQNVTCEESNCILWPNGHISPIAHVPSTDRSIITLCPIPEVRR